jgi:hypothetical protein
MRSGQGQAVFGYGVAFGDDLAGLVDCYWSAVDVTQLVGLFGAPAGDDPGNRASS